MRILIRLVLWTWFLAALAAGGTGLLENLPPMALPGLMAGLTIILLACCLRIPAIRSWLGTVEVRGLVLLHVSRLVGYALLVLNRRGQLPSALAVPGGWGEIVVAALAMAVVLIPMSASLRRHACIIWNTFGLVNVLLLVSAAARLEFARPGHLGAFRLLPCSMLPTFLVPLIIATHAIIYARLRAPPGMPDSPSDQTAQA